MAVFDVWKYEEDSLRRELIRDVGRQLTDHGQLPKNFDLDEYTERLDVDVSRQELVTRRDPGAIKRALWHGGLVGVGLLMLTFGLPRLGASDSTVLKLLLPLVGAAIPFVWTALGTYLVAVPVQRTEKRLEFPDQFAKSFAALLDEVCAERLIIAVDNLDRCAPGRVAAMLATIKTFLEPSLPTNSDKRLVFVIAADDEALRRHLIAQELADSGGAAVFGASSADGRSSDGIEERLPVEVRDSVDEYLRKFFNAVIRITELLDEDVRIFTRSELQPFVKRHALSAEAQSDLVELVAAGLKRNPRRVKQFINNLELKLQLLERRRTEARIQIDPDVRVVAKLAILQEEWPERYGQLLSDPRLLEKWQDQAATGRDDESELEEGVRKKDLDSFLRLTDHIPVDGLRPYLTLKQTSFELELPQYGEFADLVQQGDTDALLAFLDDLGEKRDDYVSAVGALFRSQVRDGFWGAANNVVRVVIELPELGGEDGSVTAEILDEVLSQPALCARLPALSPAPLFEAAHSLPPTKFNRVVEATLGRFEDPEDSEGRTALSEALAAQYDELHAPIKRRISRALAQEEIRKDLESYAALAPDGATDFPPSVLAEAVGRIEANIPDVEMDSASYRVATSVIRAKDKPDPAVVERFARAIWQTLADLAGGDAGSYEALSRDAAPLIASLAQSALVEELITDLQSRWPSLSGDVRLPAFELAATLLSHQDEEVANQFAPTFVQYFSQEPSDAQARWLEENIADLPRAFETQLVEMLATNASTETAPTNDEAAAYLTRLPPDAAARSLQRAVELAIGGERYGRAAELLNAHVGALADQHGALVDSLLEEFVEASEPTRSAVRTAVGALEPAQLSEDQLQPYSVSVAESLLAKVDGSEEAFSRDWRGCRSRRPSAWPEKFSRAFSRPGISSRRSRRLSFCSRTRLSSAKVNGIASDYGLQRLPANIRDTSEPSAR